jgi:diguanylate cyclase (GGDEF)-like protein/PAS domain S-box-containing protein
MPAAMVKKWNSLGVQEKLHILIQGSLIILFFISVEWVINRFEAQITASVEARAVETADGLINGMNMLMLTGTISNPDNRQLLLKKMSQSKGVKELRIIRAKQVQDQFGPGLPGEQALDDIDREVVASGKTVFQKLKAKNGATMLRVVVPFIAQENFRGTNCLSCHHVKSGSVNGAASVTIDLTEEEANIAEIKQMLWLGQLAIQVLLSIIISLFVRIMIVRNIAKPVKKLQMAMAEIQHDEDLSKRVDIDENNADIGEMANSFNSLLASLQYATERLDLFSHVFESSSEAIVITDAEHNIVVVNLAFTLITGYDLADVMWKNPKLLSSGRQTPEFYQSMWQSINETGRWQGEIWNRRKNGEIFPEWLSISTVKDGNGKVTNYIAIFNDITRRKESEQQIQFLAHYDALTKLPNRTLFADRIQQALATAKRGAKKVALLFLDLDRFKSINDSLGHLSGDLLLQSVANRLKSCVREMDTVCRQGGDEFMVLLTEIDKAEDATYIALKIISAMSDAHLVEDSRLIVTFSIGISIYPDDAADSLLMIKNADAAMYHAKEKGRNNFQFFTPDMNAEASERLVMEGDLRRAVQQNEFVLRYQPQIDNRSGNIVGMEALVRWQHPDKGLISPARFIPIAEDCGLINSIGEWVLKTACIQNKKWQDEGLLKVPVAVNISALQFHQKNFKESIAQALQESGLEPGYLELEITEGIAIKDIETTVRSLNELKLMGVLISIDDFGTGYSSLSYLKRFPIDKLKIDQSFVCDLTTDADDAAIVQTIISMGHGLRFKVIAEGVETAEQLAFLKEKECDEIQGYYFSKPLTADDFSEYVKSHTV